ncbi:DEAD/DEAH box helicase [Actinospongicola halichondriae]|uniref:DEAD/DEAH box helicase n=1 Tax=Actinospongicola halichondriae TaxID=3236844 RepID=UPI003D3DB64E
MHLGPRLEATFVAGAVGRDGVVALWDPQTDDGAGRSTLNLMLADGPADVPADLVPVAELIGPLAALAADEDVRPSVRALSVATRLALDLISRGRLLPSAAANGADTWRIGPLDVDDRTRLTQLADALPAAVHALPTDVPGRMLSPHVATTTYLDAVADAFVRTSSAAAMSGSDAFAAQSTTDVTAVESWLSSVTAGTGGDTMLGLRVELPKPKPRPDDEDDPDPFDHADIEFEPVRCVLQVQSRVDPSLVLDAAQLWTAPAAVIARFGTDVETDLLLTLRRAASVWPPAGRLLQESTPEELELTDEEVEALFGPVADDLAAAGLPVLWPSEVFAAIELRPVVGTAQPEAVSSSGLDLDSIGEVRWDATVDGAGLTESELLQLAQAKRPVVRLRGRWVRADPARLKKLNERTEVGLGDVLAAALSGTVSVDGHAVEAELTGPLVDLAERLHHVDDVRAREVPADLDAELRPYQERGLAWLAEMADLRLGGVLADDMGLGKTIQVLALHLLRRGSGPTLVVCPATLMSNWEREAAKFTPGVDVRRYHGTGRSLDDVIAAGAGNEGIVVCTYGIARRDAAKLSEVPWGLVVADEAQAIKNPMSRTARAMRTIPSTARFALTGTPVENRLSDLWALLDWTTPGLLGKLDTFQREVATPIERERDEEATARLSAVVQPFLLRRRKTDPHIAPDLPPKTETDHFVGLTVEQATLYKAVVDELKDDVEKADGFDRRGLVLKLLTALKQICNHPAQYLGQETPLVGRSGKLDAASDLLSVIVDEGDAALVFTQYVHMGHLLSAHLDTLGIESQFLHGSVPVKQREQMVDRFQAGDVPVFVISLKAGGTGLNLTRATHVFHYDRWWNPAVEDQASDRAWRIGQDRPVQVHRMVCEGTLEERIAKVLETKRALADSVIVGGETWVSELNDDELWALIDLGGES